MTEHDTLTRDRRRDWLVMNALHDAFRRDLDQLMHSTAGQAAVASRWQTFRGQLLFHHTAEDTEMLPLISRVMSQAEVRRIGIKIARGGGLRQAAVMFPWALAEAPPQVRGEVLGELPPPVRLLYRAVWLPRYRRQAATPRD